MVVGAKIARLRIVADDFDETIVDLAGLQGLWTTEQYLALTSASNRLLEFSDGLIEVLPMPTSRHQSISLFLLLMLNTLMQKVGGKVLYSPLRLQIRPGKFREPDLLLLLARNDPRLQDAYWLGADLVVEIVSVDDRERDTVIKRSEYAEAAIPEYWIVDPEDETFTVLRLEGHGYVEHGVFRRGDTVTSPLLGGFTAPVADVFDAS